ncbi:carboxymuconolactone decarboxylase family protein [Aspergillus homomorphus CBS 101889]|uniref:Carboxymuconolactone decarboxylase-like domain-containing protein n=1 Tax=Aspergillus homomorphus (strain CBS 101889) TaxID=1450537 RepID=A0A395I0B5_ASPHC|nr:hypothetical protein BO97DRAFT_367496 [Aspergillus homomorphus CBS 101889]RAL13236.1 hypothetical protein BO97DRAFT_367496 [Aspergillus homomorphus CBS 101889]
MRLPYAPATAPPGNATTAAIYSRIAARRAPRPLIPLDLSLLHSPPVADGWNSFLGAIRTQTVIDAGVLELAVCRVAVLTGAVYEWNAHAPLALRGGVTGAALQAVRSVAATAEAEAPTPELVSSALSAREQAVVRYADEMTLRVRVRDETFAALRSEAVGFSEREVVELTAGIAGYNCVSRVLVALDVGENNGREMRSVEDLVQELQK